LAVLAPQSVELTALGCRQAAVATARIARRLRNPVPDRLRRGFKLRRKLLGRSAGMRKFHHLTAELGRVG
jgi:hypothetical protein